MSLRTGRLAADVRAALDSMTRYYGWIRSATGLAFSALAVIAIVLLLPIAVTLGVAALVLLAGATFTWRIARARNRLRRFTDHSYDETSTRQAIERHEIGPNGLPRHHRTQRTIVAQVDVGFPEVLAHCIEGFRPMGLAWPYWQGPECSTNQQLQELVGNRLKVLEGTLDPSVLSGTPIHPLSKVLAEIHADAPNARIVIGGYPKLFGTKASHFSSPNITSSHPTEPTCIVANFGPAPYSVLYSDAQWLNDEGEKLNSAIQAAAVTAHAEGMPVSYAPPAKFKGHGLCDAHESWIHPLEINVLAPKGYEPASFHPTATGQALGYEPAFAKALK